MSTSGACAAKAPVRSFADLPERIGTGQTVYVTGEDGREIRGTVAALSASSLTVSTAGGSLRLPAEAIAAVDRYGDPLWNGVLIGGGVGALMALFADQREVPCPDDPTRVCRDAEIGPRLAAVAAGAGIGAGIDALVRRRTPVYSRRGGRLSLSAGPGGIAMTINLDRGRD